MMLRNETQTLLAQMKEFCPGLFDYCMRMTGDMTKASELVQDACGALAETISGGGRMNLADDIRMFLFREARVLAGNGWHADTASLQNPGLVVGHSDLDLIRLDDVLRHLPGEQREAILLVERYKFAPQLAAQIAGRAMEDFDVALTGAWQNLLTRLPPGAVPVGSAGKAGPIERIPNHPAPVLESHMPVTNLSEIMEELEFTRRGVKLSRGFWVFLVLAAGGAAIFYFKYYSR